METVPPSAPEIPGSRLDAWANYLEYRKKLLPNTIRLYTRTLETFAADHEGRDIDTLTRLDIEQWLTGKRGSASTFSNRVSALRSYYRYLINMEVRESDPTLNIEAPKRRQGIPKPLANIQSTLDQLDVEDAKANDRNGCHRQRRIGETRDMAVFMLETGLRIFEACSIEIDGPAPNKLLITGKGAKEGFIYLNAAARGAIDRLGGKIGIGPRAVQRRFEKADFHPHQLRHTFATELVRKGTEIGTVSKLCRHSSPTVTMVYAAYDDSRLRDAIGD